MMVGQRNTSIPTGPERDHMSMRTTRNVMLLGVFSLAGYLLATWLSGPRDPTKLETLCSHVDYLFENAVGITDSKQWRRELAVLKEECDIMPGR
jgi:hypothetical protein